MCIEMLQPHNAPVHDTDSTVLHCLLATMMGWYETSCNLSLRLTVNNMQLAVDNNCSSWD